MDCDAYGWRDGRHAGAYPEGVTANVRAFFQTMAQQAERFGIPGHALCMDLALDLENRIKKT